MSSQAIYLRALEPSDIDILYKYENDKEVWKVSGTTIPYSRYVLKKYIENSFTDIYQSGQLRLMIMCEDRAIGATDIFDFDAHNSRAGIGIIIFDKTNRGKGYATEALNQLIEYCFETLTVHQIYCNIDAENAESMKLFKKQGFTMIGIKKEWIKSGGKFNDEIMFQKLK
ncbi:MAG: GNAT family protein [Rikenellaceae bacterium]